MPEPRRRWDDDAELARLRYDSALCGAGQVDAPRTVTFVARAMSVELAVTGDSVQGLLTPPQAARVELACRSGDGGPVCADGAGRFLIPSPPGGTVRLYVVPCSGVPVITEAMDLEDRGPA